jgi:hypothetical protein
VIRRPNSFGLSVGNPYGLPGSGAQKGHATVNAPHQQVATVGQEHTVVPAHKQRNAQPGFQFANSLGNCRLRQENTLGGCTDALASSNLGKSPQLAQIRYIIQHSKDSETADLLCKLHQVIT